MICIVSTIIRLYAVAGLLWDKSSLTYSCDGSTGKAIFENLTHKVFFCKYFCNGVVADVTLKLLRLTLIPVH
jgi:hypothetical protein